MSDQIDQMTDAELSELVAVECAGWFRGRACDGRDVIWPDDCASPNSLKKWPYGISCEKFASDANAVIPLLPLGTDIQRGSHYWYVLVPTALVTFGERHEVLATAACRALLRATRANKEAGQ